MKSKLYIFALLALSVISCTREPLPEPEKEEAKIVTISASIPPETRVLYDDTDRSLSWQPGDKIKLAGYDVSNAYIGESTFTWTETGNVFTGTTVQGATTYKAYYPATVTLDETTGEVQLPAAFWQQTQNGDGTTGHLRNKLLLFDETARPITQTFALSAKSSIIKLDLNGIPEHAGELYHLTYTVETATGVFKSVSIGVTEVTFSPTVSSITAYLAFDPTEVVSLTPLLVFLFLLISISPPIFKIKSFSSFCCS